MVSLTSLAARSSPGRAAHRAPPRKPSRITRGSSAQAGQDGNARAPAEASQAPRYSWPSPPTLMSPRREGRATATAVSSRGVMRTSSSDRP